MTEHELNHLFTYHAPDEEQVPKYQAIRAAEVAAFDAILNVFGEKLKEPAPDGVNLALWKDLQAVFDTITEVLFEYAKAININAPDSADKSASIRCVRLARMAANEAALMAGRRGTTHGQVVFLLEIMRTEMVKARWQASAAIATHVPISTDSPTSLGDM